MAHALEQVMSTSLPVTSARRDFVSRHIGPSGLEINQMLKTIGAADLEQLVAQTVPQSIRCAEKLELGPALSEAEALIKLRAIARKNRVVVSLIGQGYHGTILPTVILRNVLENPAWYTAYTPYQPEISQGRLEAMLNFQTMICDLTGLDVANASLLDEATAAAEAMTMARRVARSKCAKFFVDVSCHPQTIAVLRTRAQPLDLEIVVGDPAADLDPTQVFGALMQYPGTSGEVRDFRPVIEKLHSSGAIAAVAADPLALALLIPPGEMNADIAIGSTQRFGMPMGFGGPHAAYIATKESYKRSLPGRLVGVSIDTRGRKAYRLALQTREQHIRRESATSNICTAQVLPAVIASMYAVYHGQEGLRAISSQIHLLTSRLAQGLQLLGWKLVNSTFFDTLTIDVRDRSHEIIERSERSGMNFRVLPAQGGLTERIAISLDETTTPQIVEAILKVFGGDVSVAGLARESKPGIPAALMRTSEFLSHPVFRNHQSETEMLRYLRRLADRDLALDRAMIPLGSCTMKLNATTEMTPITWPEFCDLHPFVPHDQARGYEFLVRDLEQKLCEITGYDAVSLQPNSGAQGELAGLLAIRAYHRSRGDDQRRVCLIPSSAHGTNPASAQMAGMTVIVVKCDEQGNVDLADLAEKAEHAGESLAAVMITYPSTHGVFEEHICDICDIVHRYGGQVYLDGANLNAQVGLARPGRYGADVSHLNLHKTFCIPHGGGGPGMGPIGVRSHLAPYLPGHLGVQTPVGPVSAAPFGSAVILAISWTYIAMMGGPGLTRASEVAILNANYIAERLNEHYPVLYRGPRGRVAHECIIDLRSIREKTGITVDDVAKRLIDYGFHAPTMSFPVPGTFMIEPTESESKVELDRFCDALIAIRHEIADVQRGVLVAADSPLRHAPHSIEDVTTDEWTRSYSRSEGCYPRTSRVADKYWAPVNRVDNVYGDRNLMCSCPPLSAYQDAAE
jgi:glycine dehydrogenase